MIYFYYICLLTAVGLSPGRSTHLHTNNTEDNKNNNRTTQITTNVEECGPCPVFARFTLAFALQLRKKQEKTSVRLRKTLVRVQYTYYQNTHTLQNIKPPQYKLKQTQYKIYEYCDCLFNIFAATLNIGGCSSFRNLRTCHAVVTRTHLSMRSLMIWTSHPILFGW